MGGPEGAIYDVGGGISVHAGSERRVPFLRQRVYVKRILRKYGYPPDKQEKATQTVLEQACAVGDAGGVTRN